METINQRAEIKPVFNLLKFTFGVVPIVAGLDKFTNLLTNWEQYLHPAIASIITPHLFMMIIGLIEIAAGVIVLLRPAIGGLIVAAWLTSISLTLLFGGHFLDVAVRDLVMAVSAYAMTRIAKLV